MASLVQRVETVNRRRNKAGGRHWLASIGSRSAADVSSWLMLRLYDFQAGIKKIVNSFADAHLEEPRHVLSDSIVCSLLLYFYIR